MHMKTISLFFSMMLLVICMSACKGGPTVSKATGSPGDLIVVMEKASWTGPAGLALKDLLSSDVPGLTQPEPVMNVSYTEPKHFDRMLQMVRNILVVEIDPTMYTKATMKYSEDRWARGQVILKLQAPDAASLELYITNNGKSIIDFFVKTELNRSIKLLDKTYSSYAFNKVKEIFDVELKAPESMKYYKDTTDFFWTSNNSGEGRRDIIIYSFPYTDKNTFTKEYLLEKRDSVLKANIPGSFENSYMTTETRFGVNYNPITVKGKYCAEIRGLWKMVGDMMGGPFVSHARLDETNQRVVVVEGFVYAPEKDKRNLIRQVEASLYTLKLPGEFDQKSEEPIQTEVE
jgi:hypothetical protein